MTSRIIHAVERLITVEKPANYTTVSKRLAQNLNRVLRCVRNLTPRAHTLFSRPPRRGSNIPENGVGRGWRRGVTEAGTRSGNRDEYKEGTEGCCATRVSEGGEREGGREGWGWKETTTAPECIVPCWTFPLRAEWNRFLRKSKHSVLPTAEHCDFLREPIRPNIRRLPGCDTTLRRSAMPYLRLRSEIFAARWYVVECLIFVFPLRLHLSHFANMLIKYNKLCKKCLV